MIPRGIPAQARDHHHLLFDTGQSQGDRGQASIDHHHPAPWQPAADLFHQLPHPIDAGVVPSSLRRPRGPTPRGQKG
jgi:hypothetical protein